MAEKFLRTRDVLERTGIGRTSLWRLERTGEFPPRRALTTNVRGWLESEVTAWLQALPVTPNDRGGDVA
jgi:prophage regulatory protein